MPQDANIRSRIEQACVNCERELRAFLAGVLRDPHLAEDAVQKTIIRALETDAVPESDRIRAWLFQVALNTARDLRRKRAREDRNQQAVRDLASARQTTDSVSSIAKLITSEERELVQQALQQLSPHYREVVIRRLQQGQTFAEIAEDLNRPLGTVLTWMRRALHELRQMAVLRSLSSDIPREPKQ